MGLPIKKIKEYLNNYKWQRNNFYYEKIFSNRKSYWTLIITPIT
jgi:hypothetical protein